MRTEENRRGGRMDGVEGSWPGHLVVLEFGEQREHYPRRLAKSRYAKYLSLEQRAQRVIIAGERAFEWGSWRLLPWNSLETSKGSKCGTRLNTETS